MQKLFKGENYSRAETIRGNTVFVIRPIQKVVSFFCYTVGYALLKMTFKKDLNYMFDICYVCLKSNIFSTNIHNLILQLEAKYYVTMFKLTFTIYAHLSQTV